MDALISLVYTIIDSVCVCLFLDAFASHRWRDHRFLVGVIVQTILMYASIEFSVIALNRNQIVKIFLILLSCFIVARTLYENISGRFLLFLIVVEYLLTYDLSNLPFDASDIVVLLSNLLDNAIEACQQYDKGDKAIHVMAVAQQDFFVSVRNTSEPVVIINGSIPTTKPEPQMHGFGLANIRLILEKYSGEYTMFYENGWFQFTADIPLTPIS